MIKINPTNQTRIKKTTKNSQNGKVQIQIPKESSRGYGKNYGWLKGKKITHDKGLINRDELEIIRTYKTILRGIIQYFCLACNLGQLTFLAYLAEYSCWKTLAGKHKTSIARVRKKFQLGKTWGIKYDNRGKPQKELWQTYDWKRIKGMRNTKGETRTISQSSLLKRSHLPHHKTSSPKMRGMPKRKCQIRNPPHQNNPRCELEKCEEQKNNCIM